MNNKIIFDAEAMRYDLHRQKIIPCFDIFYKTAVELIPFRAKESFSFLDLGAGTGLLTALILNSFPEAHATMIDISEKMLAVARHRFSNNTNISFRIMNYADSPLSGIYDLVVSAMSIHHLAHTDKIKLTKKIYGVLNPGGLFINADLVQGANSNTEKQYQQHWKGHIERAGLNSAELDLIQKRMAWDLPADLDTQLMWMRDAGFVDVDCFYKYFNFVVYAGKKIIEKHT